MSFLFDDTPSRSQLMVEVLRRRVGSTSDPGVAAPAPPADRTGGAVVTMLRSGDLATRAETVRQQADAADAEALDVGKLADYARGRKDASERALLLALAAQQAGSGFQPVAEHFLAQARSNAQPTKLDHGILADGEYVADPAYGRQRRIDAMRRQADNLERMAQTAATAEDRAEAARQAAQARQELAGQQMEFRREIEAGRREDRLRSDGLRADLVAATRAEREKREAEERAARERAGIDRDVQALSKRGDDIAPLVQAAREVDDMLTRYGTESVPGVGYSSMLPGVMLSKEGTVNRSRVQAVANALLKAQSGAAVTLSESERFAAEMLANGKYSEAEFRAAWPLLRARINAGIDNLTAGFRPEVVEAYRGRGGNISRIGGTEPSAGDLSPQERTELDALRQRFPRGAR